ncbi:hypothetical protein [Actinoplanes siamensis]|uniref:Lipoprotein n=1 Tax=Actinoplanes siamensis TaxID=1223317 RepID=A0A919NE93_9ACTN|nr:hypothetical protein [Actinoplanes siamensis]GIF09125.1 hypothetical protein Asi03nite_66630 [Actinoplanes siamensis]
MRVRGTAAATALLAVLAGGCARADSDIVGLAPAPVRSGPATPAIHDRWESCDSTAYGSAQNRINDGQDALTLPLLDDGFQPVSAIICGASIRERPGGGTELVAEEARADDLTTVLSTLRLSDEGPTAGVCTMEMPAVPWLALLDDDGRWIRPGVPVDACGKPRREFRTAFEKLATTTVKSRVVQQVVSDEAASSGCSQSWADMAWAMGGAENRHGTALAPLPERANVRRCVYDVPAAERGSAKPAGDFRSGGPLPATGWTAIRAEIEASAPSTATCSTPASSFAVLHLEPGGTIYIEADGCRRILLEPANGPSVYRLSSARLTSLAFDK